ncbi:MAG: sterol desaturase family protein [Candidatus Hydrogenedentes bacterium]|nr:sterol desaturase family protein [Candidatus Hydrogenedentota bacterium]
MTPLEQVAHYLLLFAIPYFFALIFLEAVAAGLQGKKLFRINDSITDINSGILDRVLDAFVKTAIVGAYMLVYNTAHVMTTDPSSVTAWIVCFVLVDFLFYWAHRMCHTLNFLWACHIVHHSSEEMNLTVALRQSATETLFVWVFYLPLAIAGFPWEMWFICYQINLLYQFWVHTRLVPKMGPVEWVMNTPSHHRVHHGADVKYIDKNHAGTFIIWDRLFGTFKVEEEEPIFGVVSPVKTWNPLWAHTHYWVRLVKLTRLAPDWKDKIRVWFREPAFMPKGVELPAMGPNVRSPGYTKWNPWIPKGLTVYALAHFVLLQVLFVGFGAAEEQLPLAEKALPAGLVLFTLLCLGGILEGRPWARIAEPLRIGLIALALLTQGGPWFAAPWAGNAPTVTLIAAIGVLSLGGLYIERDGFKGRDASAYPNAGQEETAPAR